VQLRQKDKGLARSFLELFGSAPGEASCACRVKSGLKPRESGRISHNASGEGHTVGYGSRPA
jgi:hypothetical protein